VDRITSLPKVELHLHIEGTLEPELIFELASRAGTPLPDADLEALRARYHFDDLQSFLDLYYENMAVLRTADDFAELAYAYAIRAASGGVVHAEVFFDPQAHLTRGVALEAVVSGLRAGFERAEIETGFTASLIACFLRDRPESEAMEVLEALLAIDPPILGVGLDSAEVGNPAFRFRAVFDRAAEAGLHRVAHAGEEGGPDSVEDALDSLHAERIDHGIRSREDPELLARLTAQRIPLTVCPLSNVALKAVTSIDAHPLPQLLEAGVLVTINSDDPAYFGGYAADNFAAVTEAFDLDDATLALLARNSVSASFLSESRKAELSSRVDAWLVQDPKS
jgi:adenosine deaminase